MDDRDPTHSLDLSRRRLCAAFALLPLAWRGATAAAAAPSWGIDLSHLRRAIAPGEDFYAYVNQGWIDAQRMPAGYSNYNELNAMFLRTQARIKTLIEDERALPAGRSRLADLYASYTDQARMDAAGFAPIRADLDAILAIDTHEQAARRMAHPLSNTLVGTYVFLDAGDTRRSRLHLDQQVAAGRIVALPSAAHYDPSNAAHAQVREAYERYIAATLQRAGIAQAAQRAASVFALEARIAALQWTATQLRDRRLNYHPMTVTELEAYAPGFPWRAFLAATGYPPVDAVVLNTDTAIRACAQLFARTPLDEWRAYLAFHWIDNHAHLLSADCQDAKFRFYGATLAGQTARRPLPDRGVQFVGQHLPELVGARYVAKFFAPAQRRAIEAMAPFLKQALCARIERADWLDAATRAGALAKAERMQLRLGYPDDLRDYAEVAICPTDPIGNLHRLKAGQIALDARHLSEPGLAYRWHLPPQSVDGSYSPQLNAVTFPAGLLQAPAFDAAADMAVNFGAIGAVLGHEMAHGFDDQGARFDAAGNLSDGWTQAARAAFDARADVLVAQYDAYRPLPGAPLDGRRSLGENLSDLVGVALALDAYRLYAAAHGIDLAATRDGFAGEQRFFLGWAQLWRCLETPASLKAETDRAYHSPARYRVNGVVRNLQAWYEAFGVDDTQALYLAPEARARVW